MDRIASPTHEHRGRSAIDPKRLLALTWIVIFPAFTLLVLRSIYERVALNLQEVWPWLDHHPTLAFIVGAVYLAAHWWCVAWYLLTVRRTGRLTPWLSEILTECRPYRLEVASALAILAVEYAPLSLWRWLDRSF